jgi:hypothetical protein
MTPSDPCKHCGACQNHVRCACCGFCRNCGVFIAAPYWPWGYPYTAPLPYTYPFSPFVSPIRSSGGTVSAGPYNGSVVSGQFYDPFYDRGAVGAVTGNSIRIDANSPNVVFTTISALDGSLPGASNGCFAGATA